MGKKFLALTGGADFTRHTAGIMYSLATRGHLQKFDAFVGTSGGGLCALDGAKYLYQPEKFKAMWDKISKSKDMYDGMMQVETLADKWGMFWQFFKDNKGVSILKPTGLYKVIDEEFQHLPIGTLSKRVIITTTNMSKGDTEIFDSEKQPFADAALIAKATSAIPGGFPGVERRNVDGTVDVLSDGGVLMNNPVSLAIKEPGASHVLLIGAMPDRFPRVDVKNAALDLGLRTIAIMLHQNEEEAWTAKAEYENMQRIAPDKFPPIKIKDVYPENVTGDGLHVDPARFQAGIDFAEKFLTDEVMNEFFA